MRPPLFSDQFLKITSFQVNYLLLTRVQIWDFLLFVTSRKGPLDVQKIEGKLDNEML